MTEGGAGVAAARAGLTPGAMLVGSALLGAGAVLAASAADAASSDARWSNLLQSAFQPAILALWVLLPLGWLFVQRSLFDPFGLLLAASLAFWSGGMLLGGLGFEGLKGMEDQFSPGTLTASSGFVFAGLLALAAGGLLARACFPAIVPVDKAGQADGRDRRALLVTGVVLLVIGVAATAALMRWAYAGVADLGYMALYAPERIEAMPVAPRLLAPFLLPGGMLCIATGRRPVAMIALGLLLAHSMALLLLGQRGMALLPTLAGIWLWDRCVGRVSRSALLGVGLVVFGVVFPAVRANRLLPDGGHGVARMVQPIGGREAGAWYSALAEMGGSFATVAHVVELVPSRREREWGGTYAVAMLAVAPNVWGGPHPSAGEAQPSRWLVWVVSPDWARAGGGLGFSSIAEGYLNFGWMGVVVAQMLLGFGVVFAWLRASCTGRRLGLAVFASALPALVFSARSDSLSLVRPIVWYAGGAFLLCLTIGTGLRTGPQTVLPRDTRTTRDREGPPWT